MVKLHFWVRSALSHLEVAQLHCFSLDGSLMPEQVVLMYGGACLSFLNVISAEHLEKAFYFGSLLRGISEWNCKVFDVQESSLNIYPKLNFHRHWRETLRLTPPIHQSKYRHLLAKKNPTLITFSLLRHTTGRIAPRHEHSLHSCSDFLSQQPQLSSLVIDMHANNLLKTYLGKSNVFYFKSQCRQGNKNATKTPQNRFRSNWRNTRTIKIISLTKCNNKNCS